jgi:hypothetical protein
MRQACRDSARNYRWIGWTLTLESQVAGLHGDIAGLHGDNAIVHQRMDRIEARIERRLDLREEPV